MSMMFGGHGIKAEMNITPMIDVLLVLIVIFLMTPPKKTPTGLDTQVPQPAKNSTATPPVSTIVLQLSGSERLGWHVRLNGEETTIGDLKSRLQSVYRTRAEKVLFVRAEGDMDFSRVAQVIDITRGADQAIRIGLITENVRNGD